MPPFQIRMSMRLDVFAELSTGDGGQCVQSVRLGGRNVDPVVTPSLSSAAAQQKKRATPCSALKELRESTTK
jgi:hypothetical protein